MLPTASDTAAPPDLAFEAAVSPDVLAATDLANGAEAITTGNLTVVAVEVGETEEEVEEEVSSEVSSQLSELSEEVDEVPLYLLQGKRINPCQPLLYLMVKESLKL